MPEEAIAEAAPAAVAAPAQDSLQAAQPTAEPAQETAEAPAVPATGDETSQSDTSATASEGAKTQEEGTAEEQTIPYSRFKEVNETKKELEARAGKYDKVVGYLQGEHNVSKEAAERLLEQSLEAATSQAGEAQAGGIDHQSAKLAEIETRLEKTQAHVAMQQLESEVDAFAKANPAAAPLKEKLKKLALKDPDTPVSEIWNDVYAPIVKSSGMEATDEAKKTAQVAGATAAKEGGPEKDFSKMSSAEIAASLPKSSRNSYNR